METRRTLKAGIAVAGALGMLAVGYGTAAAGPVPAAAAQERPAAAASDDDYQSTLELSDGRKVSVRLVEGAGAQERHTAEGGEWTGWKTLYATESDRCQGVDLEERNGTVSLIADFGRYCYDGEPPMESIAAVGTDDLSDWDVDITEGFDGWEDVSINDDGSKAVFLYNSDFGLYTLRWDSSEGFGEMQEPEKG